ncbi:sulfurtransferase [Synechococcales cyanobacterium C]|uniref:Sulfurtransferase n=1 Tax=Petrachloros mirabilis ULC683 TaxID=2781853 RepID=A0A8K1ZXC4_9CYAN|nr:sulfurtransferase [Petrachloros mirabilis]NCJ06914.1 sulfurtransferase [Petrachloros mirabilis ULC683]
MTDFPLVVSPAALAAWIDYPSDDLSLVIVDCRFSLAEPHLGERQYLDSHIPGAHYLHLDRDLSGSVRTHGGRHPLPPVAELAKTLGKMGITSKTQVVVYDDSRFAFAARLWWLLRYLGHDRVSVLDGGFRAYQGAGYPVTSLVPPRQAGCFEPQVRPQIVIDIQGVLARLEDPEVVLMDAREAERYRGEREPIDPVAGHIPGAVNVCWQQMTDDQGWMQPNPIDLGASWADAREIVVYCGSGVTACVNLLGLAASGLQTGVLYGGSWSDWCSYPLDAQGIAQVPSEHA